MRLWYSVYEGDDMTEKEIKELMVKRRRQIIIHSCIYYEYGKSLITNQQFDKWAYELADLQNKYPDIAKQGDWNFEFVGFDGTTGYNLPYRNQWAYGKLEQLIDFAEKNGLLL